MLILISPAKTLDFETKPKTSAHTSADFLEDSQLLIDELKKLSSAEISTLMNISDQLGKLNQQRYQQWQRPFTEENAKQALLAFKGDVYTGLDADSFKAADFTFAQKHLRILSGLYGVLRPLDLIQPYRLEMGTKFENSRGKTLYSFWGDKITTNLNRQLKESKSTCIVNLTSQEYFKAVKPKLLDTEIITPVFKDYKNSNYKIISFFAKKARGLMSAYIIKNRINNDDDLKSFDIDGYRFNKKSSSDKELVFTRKQT